MRSLLFYCFVTLAAILSTSVTSSAIQNPDAGTTSDSKPPTLAQNDWRTYGERLLAGIGGSPQTNSVEEERGTVSKGVSTLFSKMKRSVDKLKLRYQDLQRNRFLTKMEEMFNAGTTPEKLAALYGSTKKVKLQEDFRQFYKWRSSWTGQARKYPKPGNLKATPKLERLG